MKKINLAELAKITSSKLIGDPKHQILGVNSLESATYEEASFMANHRYVDAMKNSKAGVICVDDTITLSNNKNYLISKNPSLAFQIIAEALLAYSIKSSFKGIHPTAIIHPSVKVEKDVTIGPYVIIDTGSTIKKGTIIFPYVYIGPNVQVGKDCTIYPHVTIREKCILKDRVTLQAGCVIGSCGFGYTLDKEGNFQKLQQLGYVIIEDDVEIGANTTIDRARFKATTIGQGSKIDNLVQIAHNVNIGRHNAIAAQTGIAGSSKTGENVIMGGQVGVTGHVEIKDGVAIAAQAGVSKSLPPGKYRGTPAILLLKYNRQKVQIKNLPNYIKKLEYLEQKLKDLEKDLSTKFKKKK